LNQYILTPLKGEDQFNTVHSIVLLGKIITRFHEYGPLDQIVIVCSTGLEIQSTKAQ
jgi:hypothetical protein